MSRSRNTWLIDSLIKKQDLVVKDMITSNIRFRTYSTSVVVLVQVAEPHLEVVLLDNTVLGAYFGLWVNFFMVLIHTCKSWWSNRTKKWTRARLYLKGSGSVCSSLSHPNQKTEPRSWNFRDFFNWGRP